MGRIVSQARPLGLRAPPSGTAPLQSFYLGERSSFPGGLLAPLSLAVTWRNLESRALGALLDSILLVPQFVQKCNKIQNLKFQLFRPLGENLSTKLNPRKRWIDFQQRETFHNVKDVYASQGVDCEDKDYFRIKTAIKRWYHILQMGNDWIRGEEEEPAKTVPLNQLQDKAEIFDLLPVNIHSSIRLDLRLNTIDSRKIPDCLRKEHSALSEMIRAFSSNKLLRCTWAQIILSKSWKSLLLNVHWFSMRFSRPVFPKLRVHSFLGKKLKFFQVAA